VTVRALHHYDRLKLLQPRRTPGGYRVYSLADLERLEQIVALKFLGLSLGHIKNLLSQPDGHALPNALRIQRLALEDKRRHLDQAIEAIREAEQSPQPDKLRRIIEVIEMQDNAEAFRKYYDEESWAKLAEKREQFKPEDQERVSREWRELFADIRTAKDEDPASEKSQALAARWKALIEQFTGGDPGITDGLRKVWGDRIDWPAPYQARMAEFADPEVWSFIQRASASKK